MPANKICPCTGCTAHPNSCPTPVTNGRCPNCRRAANQAHGTTTNQGRGWPHQQRRHTLINAAIGTNCPDCGQPMTDPSRMVADHTTPLTIDRTSIADRVHCRACSDRQGGHLSRQMQAGT